MKIINALLADLFGLSIVAHVAGVSLTARAEENPNSNLASNSNQKGYDKDEINDFCAESTSVSLFLWRIYQFAEPLPANQRR